MTRYLSTIKMIFAAFLLFCSLIESSSAYENRWFYDEGKQDKLLFLHTLVNYEFDPIWWYEWDKNLLSESIVKFSFGSVEIHDLLVNARIVVNEKIANGLWFQADLERYRSHWVNREKKNLYMGMEQDIFSGLGLFWQFNPYFDKEYIDTRFGVSYTDVKRERYIRLGLQLDNFLWQEKNPQKGEYTRTPLALFWQFRQNIGNFWIFSEGNYGNEYGKVFNNSEKEPLLSAEKGRNAEINVRAYYLSGNRLPLYFTLYHYYFFINQNFRESSSALNYENSLTTIGLEYRFYVGDKFSVRVGGHFLWQYSESAGTETYNYMRNEIMPSLFAEYRFNEKHNLELAVMESFYNWGSDSGNEIHNFAEKGNVEKVKLGWTVYLLPKVRLQLSVSHVFSIGGFGGGNIQYLMYF